MADKFITELDEMTDVANGDWVVVEKANGSGTFKAKAAVAAGVYRRVRLGVKDITVSGFYGKLAFIQDIPELAGYSNEDLDKLEVDIEAVGGGAGGSGGYSAPTDGSAGGAGGAVVRKSGVPFSSIGSGFNVTIGAGTTGGDGNATQCYDNTYSFSLYASGGKGRRTDDATSFIWQTAFCGPGSGFCPKGQAQDTTLIQGRDGPGAGGCHGNGIGGAGQARNSTVFDYYGSGGKGGGAGSVPGGGAGGYDSNAGQSAQLSGRGQVRVGFFKWTRI
jgi:hypothetical protein